MRGFAFLLQSVRELLGNAHRGDTAVMVTESSYANLVSAFSEVTGEDPEEFDATRLKYDWEAPSAEEAEEEGEG